MSTGILKDLRVIDLSRMLSGPYCTMHLADHGAEVIKIESGQGDTSRGNGPFREDDPNHDWAGYFVSLNRGKKSIRLDLKTPEGKASFRKLVATADVVVENFRPGVMDRLGLSYETLAKENPRLVYAAIRGFGDPRTGESPYSGWPSYDVVAQAMGGLIAMTGPDADTPIKTGPGVGDIFAGMMMSFGIMAALREAEATGKGQFVDVAMYDAMISLCERMVYLHDMKGIVPEPEGNSHPFLAPFGLYPARDGHVALGIVDDAFWRKLAKFMDRPELADDPRFATRSARAQNSKTVDGYVSAWTQRHSKDELTVILGGEVPYGPLNTVADIARDPHVAARGMFATIAAPDSDRKPWTVAANPIRFGGHAHGALSAPPMLGADNGMLATLAKPKVADRSKPSDLEVAFDRVEHGFAVVTACRQDGTPYGVVAQSFASVSFEQSLLLVCIPKGDPHSEVLEQAEHFAVNVLASDQRALAKSFGVAGSQKFIPSTWRVDAHNLPLIVGAMARFSCVRHRKVDGGDHIVLVGRILDFKSRPAKPLVFDASSNCENETKHAL